MAGDDAIAPIPLVAILDRIAIDVPAVVVPVRVHRTRPFMPRAIRATTPRSALMANSRGCIVYRAS